jgi:tRNA threonylcarbamoyladenosine biosynthesis protein TsaB
VRNRVIILGFDSSSIGCSAGIFDTARQTCHVISDSEPRRQAERLVPLINRVLSESGLEWNDVTHLVTPRGPGSFTGLRIALSVAKGLHLTLQKPVITPDAFSLCARAHNLSHPTLILIDTLRGDWYGQVTNPDGTAYESSRIYSDSEAKSFSLPPLFAADINMKALLNEAAEYKGVLNNFTPLYLRGAEVSSPKNPIPTRADLFGEL